MIPLPPPSQMDYLLFLGYLLDGRPMISHPGINSYIDLFREEYSEDGKLIGVIYSLDHVKNGHREKKIVGYIVNATQRVVFELFERGDWQKPLELWYDTERKKRLKRLTAGAPEEVAA